MGTSLGVSDSMSHIASKLSMLVPFAACSLHLWDEATDTLRCRFSTGVDAELMRQLALKNGQGLTGWVARNRRSLVNARPIADLEAAGVPMPTSLQSALVCPLIFDEQVIGTLAVYHTTPGFYTDDHRRLLDRVCEQAAAVIKNAMVFEKTHEASLTDPLTGLPTRNLFLQHLDEALTRARKNPAARVAVLFLVAWEVMALASFFLVTFEDETGLCEAVAFPPVLRRRQRPFRVGEVVSISGRTTLQDGLDVFEVQ